MSERNYDVVCFLRALRRQHELINLVAIDPEKEGSGGIVGRNFAADDSEGMARFIEEWNQRQQYNIYFTLNQVGRKPQRGKTKKSYISAVLGYGVDLDPPDDCEDLEPWRDEKLSELQQSHQPPTAIWCSGNGLQAVWMLHEPVPVDGAQDREQHEDIGAALARQYGGDHIKNIDRLFRLPDTKNYPDARKRAKGRELTQAYVIEWPNDRRYSPEDFADLVREGALPACGHTPLERRPN